MSEKKKKEKKEKVVYIDDGRTIADMSNVGRGYSSNNRPSATWREKMRTFWEAFKMMLIPTLIVVGALIATYFLMYFVLS